MGHRLRCAACGSFFDRDALAAEFVYDERDRTFKLIEVNARPWWYVEFAARCGVDVCAMAYRDALDQDIDPVDGYRTGVTCVNTRPDLVASLGMIRRGELKPGKALVGWLRAEKAIFHVDDPLPSVSDFVRSVDKWFRGLWRAREGA